MRALHMDFETRCKLDLTKVGLYRYVRSKTFKPILFSYRFSDELFTTTIDLLRGEKIPAHVIKAVKDPTVIKKAWNIAFEYEVWCVILNERVPFINWRDTMAKSAYNGYPLKLESASDALKLPFGKMKEGKALVKYFCQPVKTPKKKDNFRIWNEPEHAPDKWALFCKYNNVDVDAEVEIDNRLPYELPLSEVEMFELDQAINSYGIMVDVPMVRQAVSLVGEHFDTLKQQSKEITELENPNSVAQLQNWYEAYSNTKVDNFRADTVEKILKTTEDKKVKTVLFNRQELSLSSVKKYAVMLRMQVDGIMRGLHQYYGANRTGRFAGRGVQVQNLPGQGDYKLKQLAIMRGAVHPSINRDNLCMMFSDVLAMLKTLIRTAFIPRPNTYFIIADWSAIEARILAWLSGCTWRMQVFATHGKIYEASAAKMFGIPIEAIGKDSKERKKGKVSELALGYQGWVGALLRMGALEMGLSEKELPAIAGTWRRENPEIADKERGLWARCERAFKTAFEHPGKTIRFAEKRLAVRYNRGTLEFTLPSGRQLFYPNARCVDGKISYYGIDQTNKKWSRTSLYGGKITENAVQAIARDILCEGLKGVSVYGHSLKNIPGFFNVVMHIHDELVIEVPGHVEEAYATGIVHNIMTKTPDWAPGLVLKCDIFTAAFYRKSKD